ALALDPVATVDLLRRVFPGTDREGSDVTWVVAFGLAAFEGGEPDVRCCAEGTADELLDALIDGDRSVTLELAETPRERGREWAESLGIKELVGSFTTRFTPGQARVQNIQRIADLTRGVVIEPGETFSVNDFVGPRTREKGFVPA